jgi:ABC-type polysaccharide/polyol phosphate export permease
MTSSLLADAKEMVTEQFAFRALLFQMIKRDLLLRYKQTVMGFGWAIFMPLMNTAVFSIIFAKVANVSTPVAYPLYAYCGFWAWNFFASSLRFSVTSLTSNSNLVQKVYFPREIFPFSMVVVCLVDFAVGAVVLVGLMIWYGVPVTLHLLWLPVVLAVNIVFTAAIAMLLSMGNLFYRDVKYLFEIVITLWMFASSVFLPVDQIGGTLGAILAAQPISAIIDAYRATLLYGQAPPAAFLGAAVTSVAIFSVAWLVFHRLEFKFAERI